jgi:RNA polymerase subunit RPABC4/transcription elongation factor Spt4
MKKEYVKCSKCSYVYKKEEKSCPRCGEETPINEDFSSEPIFNILD